jgi:exonuclease VII small subunit
MKRAWVPAERVDWLRNGKGSLETGEVRLEENIRVYKHFVEVELICEKVELF